MVLYMCLIKHDIGPRMRSLASILNGLITLFAQVSSNIDYISIMPAAVNTSLGYTAIYGA